MKKARSEHIITVIDKKHDDRRHVMNIGGIPFYQSTGRNSQEPHTWFPFFGLIVEKQPFAPKGMFIKPNSDLNEDFFPKKIINHIIKNYDSLQKIIFRFGNFEAMCISMLMGGGFWENKAGVLLKIFILQNYEQEIEILRENISPALNEVKNIGHGGTEFSNDQPEQVNKWLVTQGATVENLAYNDFKTQKMVLDKPSFRQNASVTPPSQAMKEELLSLKTEQQQQSNYSPERIQLIQEINSQMANLIKDGGYSHETKQWNDATSRYPQKYTLMKRSLEHITSGNPNKAELLIEAGKLDKYDKGGFGRSQTGILFDRALAMGAPNPDRKSESTYSKR